MERKDQRMQCSDFEWESARDCGLMFTNPGTNEWDAALARFASLIRNGESDDSKNHTAVMPDLSFKESVREWNALQQGDDCIVTAFHMLRIKLAAQIAQITKASIMEQQNERKA